MARKFLYVVAGLIVLAIAASLAYRIWGQQLISATLVPSAAFLTPPPLSSRDYARADLWVARPDRTEGNPALWLPSGFSDAPASKRAAIFFVHPTSYIAPFNRAQWNMPLDDREATDLAARFVRMQASALNGAGDIWAPRYRQAHFGAFLSGKADAARALDAAYADVAAAFEAFLAANPKGPILLASHSQGTRHLLRLLRDKVGGADLTQRIAAVYAVGWPISVTADLPALGLPACTARGQSGCILGWQSFAEPAGADTLVHAHEREPGLAGLSRKGTRMLCTNPLTGTPDSAAKANRNLGTLVAVKDDAEPRIVPGAVPARCDARGILLIGAAPDMGPFVLPGNNYHVYDYALFWADIRRDARERLSTFQAP